MSKIITKKQLNLVIESTMKEAGLQMEENQTCECGGTIQEGICNECGSSYMEENEKPDFLDLDKDGDKEESMKKASEDKEVEEGIFDKFKKSLEPKEEEEDEVEEGFGDKMKKALQPKEEKDEVEESVSELTESVANTTNNKLLKEQLEKFNKMVNYRN